MANVLITSIGRQTELASAFGEVLQGRGCLLAADADEMAPGLTAADEALVSPPWRSDEYVEWLCNVCHEHEVVLLLTLHETDLDILEGHRERLESEGVVVLGTPYMPVDAVTDKYLMPQRIASYGVASPPTYRAEDVISGRVEIDGPVIVKPRAGRGSEGLERLASAEALSKVPQCRDKEAMIVQPQVKGQEYGMDVVNDLNGRFRGALVRRKLRMRNGETDRAETIHDSAFVRIGEQLAQCTQHRGLFDVDLILGSDGPKVIDINPRFGGGYMFNHAAGANVPAALVGWLEAPDECDEFLAYEAGVVSQRLSLVRRVAPAITRTTQVQPGV